MPIYKYLDLSTAHITQTDSHLLDQYSKMGDRSLELRFDLRLIVRPHPYGMWIHVPVGQEAKEELTALAESLTNAGFSPALMQIIIYAMSKDCYWINLDQDANEEEGLPTYEW